MASHPDVTRDTGMKVYFRDPASPWQRGTNEHTNTYFYDSIYLSSRAHPDVSQTTSPG